MKAALARVYRALRWRLSVPTGRLRQFSGWYPIVRNVNGADESSVRRRALMLYRIQPFQRATTDPEFLQHHNMRRCRRIAALLDEFGYSVDAANGRDARTRRPRQYYDLVLSDRADLRGSFPEGTKTIFLATAPNHLVHNANLRRRHERIAQRRSCDVRQLRVYSEVMPYALRATAIIAIGNEASAGTWRQVFDGPIHRFDGYGFQDTGAADDKDFESARKHFLFFASRSQVQKGLDLLLEIFPRLPDLHLHICSLFEREREFCACYRRELFETPNIHSIGWIQANGQQFRDLTKKCAYVIHPSCSEGQAGSVLQCMQAGLIPLVTRATGIDVEDFGVEFPDDELETIERTILEVTAQSPAWHEDRCARTRRAAETSYSEEAFNRRWRTILADVLSDP